MIAHGQNSDRLEDVQVQLEAAVGDLERLRADALAHRAHRAFRGVALAVAFVGGAVFVVAAPPSGNTATAPFEVFGSSSKHPMMIIGQDPSDEKGNVLMLYKGSDLMLKMQASDALSFIAALSPDGQAITSLGVDGTSSYLKLRKDLKDRVSLDVTDAKPFVRLKGTDGHGVLEFHEGDEGGGELLMAQPGGQVRVKAGVSIGGVGKVEVWPQDNAYTRGSPIGAFIVGQKGG